MPRFLLRTRITTARWHVSSSTKIEIRRMPKEEPYKRTTDEAEAEEEVSALSHSPSEVRISAQTHCEDTAPGEHKPQKSSSF